MNSKITCSMVLFVALVCMGQNAEAKKGWLKQTFKNTFAVDENCVCKLRIDGTEVAHEVPTNTKKGTDEGCAKDCETLARNQSGQLGSAIQSESKKVCNRELKVEVFGKKNNPNNKYNDRPAFNVAATGRYTPGTPSSCPSGFTLQRDGIKIGKIEFGIKIGRFECVKESDPEMKCDQGWVDRKSGYCDVATSFRLPSGVKPWIDLGGGYATSDQGVIYQRTGKAHQVCAHGKLEKGNCVEYAQVTQGTPDKCE